GGAGSHHRRTGTIRVCIGVRLCRTSGALKASIRVGSNAWGAWNQQLRETCMLTRMKGFATTLSRDEQGTALLEYTILLGIIVVAVITTVTTVGAWTSGKWTTFCNALPGHGTC